MVLAQQGPRQQVLEQQAQEYTLVWLQAEVLVRRRVSVQVQLEPVPVWAAARLRRLVLEQLESV